MQTPVDQYLNSLPDEQRIALQHLREVIKAVIPDAQELITYQMPTFKLHGKAVVGFAVFKKHLSLFPFSGLLLAKFRDELGGYTQTKSALHFSSDKLIPDDLVERMVLAKVEMILSEKTK